MAITFVASTPAPGATQTATTSLALTIPSTCQTDDIIVFDVQTKDANGGTVTDNDTGGNTWTTKETTSNGSTLTAQLFWKRATSGSASKTVTFSGGTTNTSGGLSVYRGCETSGDPIEAILAEANASGNNTQAQITTLTDGAWVVLTAFEQDDRTFSNNATCTSPGALTTRTSSINAAGATDGGFFHASAEKAAAGATGSFTWSFAANSISVSRAYALKPAGAGGGTTTMTADPGSFSWTGTAANARFTMPAGTGAYTWTGTAAATFKSIITSAESGTFTWTGQSVVGVFTMPASGGEFTWAGTDASTFKSFVLSALEGSYAWTGTASSLSFVMPAASGQFDWAGTAATTFKGALMEAQSGSFSWIGTDATLTYTGGGGEIYVCHLNLTGAG